MWESVYSSHVQIPSHSKFQFRKGIKQLLQCLKIYQSFLLLAGSMAGLQVSVLVVSLLLMASCGYSQIVVSQADEEGAINMIRGLIRDLGRQQPQRINNVLSGSH